MKTMIKTLVLLGVIAMGLSIKGQAADEVAKAVNFQQVELGGFEISTGTLTGTPRRLETRNVSVNGLGEMKIVDGSKDIIRSTAGIGVGGFFVAGNSTNTFLISLSSWVGQMGCRGIQDNCNVVRLASSSRPVYIDQIEVGNINTGLAGRTQVRLFDSWGSTAAAFEVFNMFLGTGAAVHVGHSVSSGVVVMKDPASVADITIRLGRQDR